MTRIVRILEFKLRILQCVLRLVSVPKLRKEKTQNAKDKWIEARSDRSTVGSVPTDRPAGWQGPGSNFCKRRAAATDARQGHDLQARRSNQTQVGSLTGTCPIEKSVWWVSSLLTK